MISLDNRTENQKERLLLYYNLNVNQVQEYRQCDLARQYNVSANAIRCSVGRITNALRLILKEDDYTSKIKEADFYKSFNNPNDISNNINIKLLFDGLTEDEKIFYLSWADADDNTILNMNISNKVNNRGYYKKEFWGGVSKSSIYENELLDNIECIYLPPLRDAENKLTEGRNSRLSRLLKKMYNDEIRDNKENATEISIVEKTKKFNQSLINESDSKIKKANEYIKNKMVETVGNVFGQSTNIQFSEINLDRIINSLRLMFFPNIGEEDIEKYRNISENSLGYNNLLYIATILAEIELNDDNDFKVILIEEPEAHLHPQLQVKFAKYIEKLVKQEDKNIQIIITTHSTVLSSSVSIENIIHISEDEEKSLINAVNIRNINLDSKKIKFLNRWLDVTKSNLLFAKGIIFVEGISEAILLPELAEICLKEYNEKNKAKIPESLEEAGVSVINMNGIFFEHFMNLYCEIEENEEKTSKLTNKCSGITDKDPDRDIYPIRGETVDGKNKALDLIDKINSSNNVRLYSSPLKTFEYDMCMENNCKIMASVLKNLWPKDNEQKTGVKNKLEKIIEKDNKYETERLKSDDSKNIYNWIENSNVGKGLFAQELAELIKESKEFNIPNYIKNAIIWACGGKVNE